MIYNIAKKLQDAIKAKGCPLRVVYGPEFPAPVAQTDSHIVMSMDRQAGDKFNPTRSQHLNPRVFHVRAVGAVIRIYACSPLAGAAVQDHERMANAVVDVIACALRVIAAASRMPINYTAAGFMTAEALQQTKLDRWAGVVYEIKFTVDRAVQDTTYQGAVAEEATIGGTGGVGIATEVDVHRAGSTHYEHPTKGGTG